VDEFSNQVDECNQITRHDLLKQLGTHFHLIDRKNSLQTLVALLIAIRSKSELGTKQLASHIANYYPDNFGTNALEKFKWLLGKGDIRFLRGLF